MILFADVLPCWKTCNKLEQPGVFRPPTSTNYVFSQQQIWQLETSTMFEGFMEYFSFNYGYNILMIYIYIYLYTCCFALGKTTHLNHHNTHIDPKKVNTYMSVGFCNLLYYNRGCYPIVMLPLHVPGDTSALVTRPPKRAKRHGRKCLAACGSSSAATAAHRQCARWSGRLKTGDWRCQWLFWDIPSFLRIFQVFVGYPEFLAIISHTKR